ncbi:MAG: RNA-binding transcriptional accessory protein [Anaerolineae bacterium]|nr:RNA-binding transcriptional accessory protein [Anaerolineae bacterium]
MKDLIGRLTNNLGLHRNQVERTVGLFDEGDTVPFIARYRKEVTGGLTDEQLADFREKLEALRRLEDRQRTVLKTIEEQGKLTPELAEAIEEAQNLQEVEDLYLPYKPKRRTRASIAREAGLEPMAVWILEQAVFDIPREGAAEPYLSEQFPTPEDAWQGARDIVAEVVSDDARGRDIARKMTWDGGTLKSVLADAEKDPRQTYHVYYEFEARLRQLKPHQVLAMTRGEAEDALRVGVVVDDNEIIVALAGLYPPNKLSPLAHDLYAAVVDAYDRLIGPAIEREVRRDLKEWADQHAINVFATNLRNLLLTPPIKNQTILGIDPGYRTGCKLAIVDPTGKVLVTGTIYPHEPQHRWTEALETLDKLVEKFGVTLIAIGNGTASRETEELAAELISANGAEGHLRYLIASEAGASVYSASPLARAELPDLDVSLRGAVSIARRAQDPLAELVKIDPKSIGVGMYQHDVDQSALAESLAWVTESVVNAVGVDANTASPALLSYVAGVGPKLAGKIVAHRDKNGPFKQRESIKKVSGMGAKTFQQAAGFLRIPSSEHLLDRTGVHPESYDAVAGLLDLLALSLDDPQLAARLGEAQAAHNVEELAAMLGIGAPTLGDIFADLQRPGRDPRDEAPPPILREDVLKMEDLRPGMRLNGTVRNVVDFGAFVDIGVKQDGLVHISQMANRRIESPYDVVGVGDIVEVTVLDVDVERGRIGLSMKA